MRDRLTHLGLTDIAYRLDAGERHGADEGAVADPDRHGARRLDGEHARDARELLARCREVGGATGLQVVLHHRRPDVARVHGVHPDPVRGVDDRVGIIEVSLDEANPIGLTNAHTR